MFVCVYMYACVQVHGWQGAHVKARGHPLESLFLPLCGCWGLNLCYWTWQQALLQAELCLWSSEAS